MPETRNLRLLAFPVAAALVVAAALAAILVLQDPIDLHADSASRIADAEELAARHAVAAVRLLGPGADRGELRGEVASLGERLEHAVERLLHEDRHGDAAADGEAAVRDLQQGAEAVLAGLDERALGSARQALFVRVAPAHERLQGALARVREHHLAIVEAEGPRANLRSAIVATGAALALILLVAGYVTMRRGLDQDAARRRNELSFRALVQNTSDAISIVEPDGIVRTQTGATRRLLGCDGDTLCGRPFADLVHPDDLPQLALLLDGHEGGMEWRLRHADGTWLHVETTAIDLREDPNVRGVAFTTRDISERKALEEQLRHRAFHDPLTQLPNRALFYDRVEQALRGAEGRTVAVLYLDVDDFKLVNDRMGHAFGDELLVTVARRLRACVRSGDTVARLGGDEFGILLAGVTERGEPVQVAERIIGALGPALQLGGTTVAVTPSIGIAESGDDTVAEDLLRNADHAMYAAKRHGKNRFELFGHGGAAQRPAAADDSEPVRFFLRIDEQREEILSRLARPEPVTAHFQPILDLRTGAVTGYEGLARFPEAPPRPPNAWFAQAHRCGLGGRLEAAAIGAVLAAGRPPGCDHVALNLSPSALAAPEALAALAGDLRGVVVEITENELVVQSDGLQAAIEELRSRGARIAVDDAGSGYAGFKQLMRLRPDVVKLDRSIVTGLDVDPVKAALVESFLHFARKLGAELCAEGVETLDELHALAELGVDLAQGYAIGRPGPAWGDPHPDALAVIAARPRLAATDRARAA